MVGSQVAIPITVVNSGIIFAIQVCLIALLGVVLAACFTRGPLAEWEERTVDLRLQLRPRAPAPETVGLVLVDDSDLSEDALGAWPVSRLAHADIITILRALDVEHMTFDILFTEGRGEGDDTALAKAIEERGDVTLAYYFEHLDRFDSAITRDDTPHFREGYRFGVDVTSSSALVGTEPVSLFRDTQTSAGAVNAKADAGDSVFRHLPMLIRHEEKLYPGLVLQTLIAMFGLEPDQIRVEPGKTLELIGTPHGTLSIPINKQLQYRVNFTSGAEQFFPVFSYLDLYQAVEDSDHADLIRSALAGRPVIIGNASTGTSDIVTTPIGRLPGVLAHATAIASILEQNHLRFYSFPLQLLWGGILGVILGILLRSHSARSTIGITIAFLVIYLLGAGFAAQQNWMIPVLPILFLAATALLGFLCFQIYQTTDDRDRTLRVLRKYVSPAVAQRALREEALAAAPNKRREITIFFSDIRAFTDWSEQNEPEVVTAELNEYLQTMTKVVNEYGGTLDKFIGDCIMVLFNTPEAVDDHAERAVSMAWEMQRQIGILNASWESRGQEPISVGMGIHTGFATVGNFGSELFSDYTAIGNSVNLAARIESASESGQILLSESTRALVSQDAETRSLGEMTLKGIKSPVTVFELVDLKESSP